MSLPPLAHDPFSTAMPRAAPGRERPLGACLWAGHLIFAIVLPVAGAAPTAGPQGTDDRLRGLVAELGYDAEVGDLCCRFVAGWNLAVLKNRVDEARRLAEAGDVTPAEVAVVQGQVLDELRGRLRSAIEQTDGKSEFFHLRTVLDSGRAQCLGNAQLLLVIGGAVGLDVRTLDVLFPPVGTLSEHLYHVGSIVRLADGKVRMIDERWRVDSPPFVFSEHFARHGIYWRVRDESNPLGLHRQVRPLDLRGVSSSLFVSISNSIKKAPGRSAEALKLVRQAVDLDPQSSYARLALLKLLSESQGLDDSVALADEVVKLDPERAEAHADRAAILLEMKWFAEAVAALDRAIELKPESPEALCQRGLALRDLGDEERALADVSECLRLDPRRTKALLTRSDLWTRRQDLAAAQRDCDAAIAIDPRSADAYWRRGHVLTLLARPAGAVRDFEAALALTPDDANLWFNVAMCRLDQRQTKTALDAFTRALALSPRHVEALANRACMLLDLDRPADALADCDRALEVDPKHAVALFNRGVSLAHLGRTPEARAAIERSVKADPSSRPRAEQAIARFGL